MSPSTKRLLLRIDDAGLNIETNLGIEAAARAGFARSVGIMACAPEFADAVRRLREIPNLAIGVHLTLNSEWTNWRWGPVLPASEVPTLVDEGGMFPLNHQLYRDRPPEISEVVAELRAQIACVRSEGLTPCYADEHMAFAGVTPALAPAIRALLARENLLYARDALLSSLRPERAAASRISAWFEAAAQADPGDCLIVTHPAAGGAGLDALTLPGKPPGTISAERVAECEALTNPRLGDMLAEAKIALISYADLR